MKNLSWTVKSYIFQTSNGQWHFQVIQESTYNIQVLKLITVPTLQDALDVAGVLQMHVDECRGLGWASYLVA